MSETRRDELSYSFQHGAKLALPLPLAGDPVLSKLLRKHQGRRELAYSSTMGSSSATSGSFASHRPESEIRETRALSHPDIKHSIETRGGETPKSHGDGRPNGRRLYGNQYSSGRNHPCREIATGVCQPIRRIASADFGQGASCVTLVHPGPSFSSRGSKDGGRCLVYELGGRERSLNERTGVQITVGLLEDPGMSDIYKS